MTIYQLKICTLGDFSVGKTSLIRRFVTGVFDEKYLSTIGVSISRKNVEVDDYKANLILWDLAGGDDHLAHQPNYLRGAAGAMLVCDLTRRETLPYIEEYAGQLSTISPSAKFVLIGNKADLADEHEIKRDDIEGLASKLNCEYYITSAKTGDFIEEAFHKLADQIVKAKWMTKN